MKKGRRDHKTAVLGMVERKGRVRAKVIKNNQGKVLIPIVRENVAEGSELYTDSWEAYELLAHDYITRRSIIRLNTSAITFTQTALKISGAF